jgi:3alpha(or 20beta)-hydroxysteroid dehydrogenase
MTNRMSGKVVLISGGARGQGAAHARLLASEGAHVIIGDVLDDAGEDTAQELTADGLDVRYRHLDVTQDADWRSAVAFGESSYGQLDVLVNNAGIASHAGVGDCTDEEWTRTIAVNQTGVFYGMRAAIPCMQRAGGGSIVNTASVYGATGAMNYIAYIASKAAVIGMTKGVAVTYGDDNIRVNVLCPGTTETPMLAAELAEFGDAAIDESVARLPIKRRGIPLDMSYAVLYLASDESAYVTGATLPVDGGYLAQ